MSLETILPFLQPIEHIILGPAVSRVMVNGDGAIVSQPKGVLTTVEAVLESKYWMNAVRRISRNGVTLTIRKFRPHWFTMQQRVEAGALSATRAAISGDGARSRKTILIAGGTDTTKTTFSNALIDSIPQDERLGVMEDTAELKIDHPSVFRFGARKEQIDASGTKTIPAVTFVIL